MNKFPPQTKKIQILKKIGFLTNTHATHPNNHCDAMAAIFDFLILKNHVKS